MQDTAIFTRQQASDRRERTLARARQLPGGSSGGCNNEME